VLNPKLKGKTDISSEENLKKGGVCMIRWAEDLGAPAVVAAADIVTTEVKPTWNRWMGIGLAVLGYVGGGVLGMGGNFVKNLGVASFPWAVHSIYDMVKEGTGVTSRAVSRSPVSSRISRSIGRYPAPLVETPFEGTRLV
jgi:hypothetical protein